ncbi:hypothetical protein TNCV_765221 [Trichonephila clavipes]|nr:hypothetical protein TNCV_765221 [Trichonephila clavipes]
MPAGWCGWFVAELLLLRLWVRPRPKLVDLHDAENRQGPMSYDYTACKRSLECLIGNILWTKLNPSTGLHR